MVSVFFESVMARRVVGRSKLSCIRHGPWLQNVYLLVWGKVEVVVVVCEFGKSKSRMSDLRKCRLGNLSNKGKLLCERMLLDEDPMQRPEDSMDYIQDPFLSKTAPVSRRLRICKARVEQRRIPKALA